MCGGLGSILKPNPTVTSWATTVVYQLERMMLCDASQELNVFIPVRQPNSTVLGCGIFRDMPTLKVSGRETSSRALSPIVLVRGCYHSC